MTPRRTCIGCRRTRSPDELVRVARGERGNLVIDRLQAGRGAWLCRGSPDCVEQAVKRKAFDRAFRCRVEYQQLEQIQITLGHPPEEKPGTGSEGLVL